MRNDTDEHWMRIAIENAQISEQKNEVPVGAVIVKDNEIIGVGHNLMISENDSSAHAEIQAITAATQYLGGKYLKGCTLYVTLEPCPMCAGALYWSQIDKVIFGARDSKRGACKQEPSLFHPSTLVTNGVLESECAALLKSFFALKARK